VGGEALGVGQGGVSSVGKQKSHHVIVSIGDLRMIRQERKKEELTA
jgi:hypothetical protein